LHQKREEIAKLLIESQANRDEISRLYNQGKNQSEKMEKLNLEVAVVVTEKAAL
jgi:hypothetical protein